MFMKQWGKARGIKSQTMLLSFGESSKGVRSQVTNESSNNSNRYEPHDCALNYKFLMVIAIPAPFFPHRLMQHANKKRD